MTGTQLFTGVDRALFAATYAERLRRARIDVAFSAVERCAASLDAVGPLDLADAYWVLRLSFVTRHRELEVFDDVFAAVFDLDSDVEMGRLRARERGAREEQIGSEGDLLVRLPHALDDDGTTAAALPWSTLPSGAGEDDRDDDLDDGDAIAIPELSPSAAPSDMDRPFDRLDEAELDRLGTWLEASMIDWPQRVSRRRRPTRSGGRIALRRTMRTAMRTGGEVMTLAHERRQRRPRPVVVLLDVSGSMEHHARAYLHLVRPLAIVHGAEVFAFATRLTRITAALRVRSCIDVIDHMNDSVGDRFSGTRVATSLQTLLHHRTWGASLRGAVVLICSDGWDTDDPTNLGRAMRRMSLLAHRIVWVNPRAAAEGFEPHAGGMAAALPYCDAFLAGNTGRAMREVIDALADT